MTTLEDFGDFVLIKVDAVHFGSDQAKQCSHHLQQLTNSNHQLIFLDFGLTRDADASSLNLLTSEIASLKSKRSGAEVILISEPHLSSSLQASALL